MTRNLVQYVRRNAGFQPIGETISVLPAGHYDIVQEGNIQVFACRTVSTDKLLRLSDTKSNAVVAEIEHFWTLGETFRKFGLVHKRGFLLYGPPGSGKTSTIAIVSNKMVEAGGLVVNGASAPPQHIKKMLLDLREVEPFRSLVVTLEDIENILKQDESTMLALLDGDASIGNVVFLATTNHPEKLEARIINRPSRFDQVVKIGMPSYEARRQYILHCDPTCGTVELESWLDLTDGFSVAQLKEVVIGVRCLGHTVEETVQRLRAGSLNVVSDKLVAKQARNRTFFEKFYATCEAKIPLDQMKMLREVTVGVVTTMVEHGKANP